MDNDGPGERKLIKIRQASVLVSRQVPRRHPPDVPRLVERTPKGDRIETTVALRHHFQRRPEVEAEEGINRGNLVEILTWKAKMFYLMLLSNSSMTTFPDNIVANFRVKLPLVLDLPGRWEVGLKEIQYPHSWCNVGENTHFVEVVVPNAVPDGDDSDSTVATAEDFTLV